MPNGIREAVHQLKSEVTDAEIGRAGTSKLNTEGLRRILIAENYGKKQPRSRKSRFEMYQKIL